MIELTRNEVKEQVFWLFILLNSIAILIIVFGLGLFAGHVISKIIERHYELKRAFYVAYQKFV